MIFETDDNIASELMSPVKVGTKKNSTKRVGEGLAPNLVFALKENELASDGTQSAAQISKNTVGKWNDTKRAFGNRDNANLTLGFRTEGSKSRISQESGERQVLQRISSKSDDKIEEKDSNYSSPKEGNSYDNDKFEQNSIEEESKGKDYEVSKSDSNYS